MARKPQRSQGRSQGRSQARSQARKNSGPAAAARRKAAIDRGLTADKVPGFDPGAALLGTDAETAGTPPADMPAAAVEPPVPETARADPARLAADPDGTGRRRYRAQDRMIWAVIAALLIAVAIAVAVDFVLVA